MKSTTLIEQVYNYCNLHPNAKTKSTVEYFVVSNHPERTIKPYMAKWKNNEPKSRKPGSGRKPKIMTAGNINRLKGLLNNWSGTSTRKTANKFKCDHSYIVKTIKNKTNICYFEKKQIPDCTEKQLKQLQLKCGRSCRKFRNRDFVIDDESYFTFKHTNKNSNVGFYSDDAKNAPKNVNISAKANLKKKFLCGLPYSLAESRNHLLF